MKSFAALLALWLSSSVSSFVVPVAKVASPHKNLAEVRASSTSSSDHNNDEEQCLLEDRRSMLSLIPGAVIAVGAGSSFLLDAPQPALADDGGKGKIVVMGGAGYVGSRVSKGLAEAGYNVVSVSRSSPSDQAAKVKANTGKSLSNIQYVSLDATKDDLGGVMKDAAVVVSCVGIPPWEKSTARAGNGVANVRIAEAAKAAGVGKYVYVSVAKEFSSGPGKFLFSEYFTGKAEAEAAASKNFGDKVVFVKPGFIDGAPPGEIRPPGPPGLAAVSPDAVAKAAVAGALGQISGSVDGYNAIMAAVAN